MVSDTFRRFPVRGNAFSFFAVPNLYTIEEASQHTKSVISSDLYVENGSSAHDSLTALPNWDPLQSPKRSALSSLQIPKRVHDRLHTRHDSEDILLKKDVFTKDAELAFGNDRSGSSSPADEKNDTRHSRMIIWLVLALLALLALAIVLGAVLGTFVSPGTGSNGPQPSVTEIPAGATPTPTSNPENNPPLATSPPHLPSIGVSGWSVPGESGYFVVWLFTQKSNGYLDRHTFNSSTGNWTRVSNFAKAKLGTPLGAASFNSKYYKDQSNYQFQQIKYQTTVVYLDDNNYLKEWIFPDNGPAEGQPGPLDEQKYIAHEKTKLAFYWPKLSYQGLSGEVREAYYECHRKNACWHDRVLKTSEAKNGTHLVAIPMQNELGVSGLFYQQKNNRAVNYKEEEDQTSGIWLNDAFSTSVPSDAAIAAFSTVRTGLSDESRFNSYLLWQDVNNTIQMSWTDNKDGWKGPRTYQAFSGADNTSALACLTGLTFPKFPLPAGTELSRCYFQAGATVREVSFDGAGWDVVGSVPVEVL